MCLAQGHKAVTPVRLEPAAILGVSAHVLPKTLSLLSEGHSPLDGVKNAELLTRLYIMKHHCPCHSM